MACGAALAAARAAPGPVAEVTEPLEGRRAGDHVSDRDRAIVALFGDHYAGLCRLATVLLGDPAAAEEAVQDAFARTYAGWWRVRRPDRAQWYLRAAVVNQCRSRSRRRRSEERGVRGWSATYEEASVGEGSDEDARADTMAVLEAVRALPSRQRAAVVLRYYEDLAEADVARVLRCSVGTVKSQLAKARATLARRLEDLGPEGTP
jgi:RNA polymerase sigma-70 factor (sigma-E family)